MKSKHDVLKLPKYFLRFFPAYHDIFHPDLLSDHELGV